MKCLCIGGAMIDTIAIVDSARIERMTMTNADKDFLLIEEGRKVEALEVSTHVGGGAVNAAVSMARQGADVAALIKLGRDARAETVFNHLMQEGISTRYVVRDARAPTGAAVMLSSHDRNAAIFHLPGGEHAPGRGGPEARGLCRRPRLHIGPQQRIRRCLPCDRSAGEGCQRLGRDQSGCAAARISRRGAAGPARFDRRVGHQRIGSGRHGSGPGRTRRRGAVENCRFRSRATSRGLSPAASPAARTICRLPASSWPCVRSAPRFTVVTDGRDGAYVGTPEAVHYCPGLTAKVAGTAGAGDAFNSTFCLQTRRRRHAWRRLAGRDRQCGLRGGPRRHTVRPALR